MLKYLVAILTFGAGFITGSAEAQRVSALGRIAADQVLHCGGVIRPGLAFPDRGGGWHGVEVDLCQAVAVAVLGPNARFEFHAYGVPRNYDALRNGADQLAFLTASEMLEQSLLPAVLPSRTVLFLQHGVMVPADSPAQTVPDLAGKPICVEPGTGADRTLEAWFAAKKLPLHVFPFQEAEELQDAYYAGRCGAMSNEMTALAALRLQAEADGHPSRLLPDVLSIVPVMAVTGRDADFAALVAWTIDTVMREDSANSVGPAGGAHPLFVNGASLALRASWQKEVVAATGSYAAIYARNLGSLSPLALPPRQNALWSDGGLFCPPYAE